MECEIYGCGSPEVPDRLIYGRLKITLGMRKMFCFGILLVDFCVAKVEETKILISAEQYLTKKIAAVTKA